MESEWHCKKCWKRHKLFWTNSRWESVLEADRQHAKLSPDCHGDIKVTMIQTDNPKLAETPSPSLFKN